MKYSFNIDEKSLYRGIKNDYKKGQTATVHTPINQSKDKNKWRNDIINFINGYQSENINDLPKTLLDKCLKKTTSEADSIIVSFFIFNKFSVDGTPFDSNSSFAMYVKEETSKTIIKRDGTKVSNTHCGRQKIHYPITLSHYSDGYNIDNLKVIDTILKINGGFAFVVNGFDIDKETKALNFRTTMVGTEGVLLSNVFVRRKGIGTKLLVNGLLDRIGVPHISKEEITDEEQKNFIDTLQKIQISSRKSGKAGEEYVLMNINKILGTQNVKDLFHISNKYPLSPYDIECVADGRKVYIEVKSTISGNKVFYMSRGERKFMNKYQDNYLLILVTNVNSNKKRHNKYYHKDIMNENIIKQEPQSIKFIVK